MKQKLPLYGIGPVYGAIVLALTVAAAVCRDLPIFASGRLPMLRIPLCVAGVLLILLGIFMWIHANFISKIDDGIHNSRLVTTGIYAWVRDPIYSAIMIVCTGILCILGNVWFLVLPFVFWGTMTVLLRATEEKWLREMFGQEYEDYCKRVNRCIPWKRK